VDTLGNRIRKRRQAKGLSQEELAKGFITIDMLDLIEQDKGKPSQYVIGALAKRLDVSVEDLKGLSDDTSKSYTYNLTMTNPKQLVMLGAIAVILQDEHLNDYDCKDEIYGHLFNNVEMIEDCNLLMDILKHIEDVSAREHNPNSGYEGTDEYIYQIYRLLESCEQTAWLIEKPENRRRYYLTKRLDGLT
jgi:transcriptional regulator with XRE-family HTH domain